MRVIQRSFDDDSRGAGYRIIPLGDIHIGAAACDEGRLKKVIQTIKEDDSCWWIGMGDYADYINMSDPRFSVATLAPWIGTKDLGDLAKAQTERFLDLIRPIAHKCLALMEGNHETAIQRHYERSIFSDIVTGIKEAGGFPPDHQLGIGYYGWLILKFRRGHHDGDYKHSTRQIVLNLHHGFGGGRLSGGKALNMERWLWTHDCDIAFFGHTHNAGTQFAAVETVNSAGKVVTRPRFGVYGGTFLRSINEGAATYSEVKGYLPLPLAGAEIHLKPHAAVEMERIRVVNYAG